MTQLKPQTVAPGEERGRRPRAIDEPVALAIVRPREAPLATKSWQICDAHGQIVVRGLNSRSLAIRMLGTYVGEHELPLHVEDEQGRPTGDRLG
jgi:hypothetical protein